MNRQPIQIRKKFYGWKKKYDAGNCQQNYRRAKQHYAKMVELPRSTSLAECPIKILVGGVVNPNCEEKKNSGKCV